MYLEAQPFQNFCRIIIMATKNKMLCMTFTIHPRGKKAFSEGEFHSVYILTNLMPGSVPPVTMPPPPPDLHFFLNIGSQFPIPGHKEKDNFPTPRTPLTNVSQNSPVSGSSVLNSKRENTRKLFGFDKRSEKWLCSGEVRMFITVFTGNFYGTRISIYGSQVVSTLI